MKITDDISIRIRYLLTKNCKTETVMSAKDLGVFLYENLNFKQHEEHNELSLVKTCTWIIL